MALRRLKPESEAYLHLDALRFLAASGVVAYHFRLGPLVGRVPAFDELRFCVDLFFIISGMVITAFYGSMATAQNFGTFMRRRLARLVPLHWATLLFYVCMGLAYLALGSTPPDPGKYQWRCLPVNAFLLNSLDICHAHTFNHVSWSISAEMFAYLLFPLSLALMRIRPWLPACLAIPLLLLNILLVPHVGRGWTNWTYDFGVLRCLPAFLLGMTAYSYRAQLSSVSRAHVWFFVIGIAFVAAILLRAADAVLLILAYSLGVAGLAADGRGASKVVRFLAPLGTLTYGIYMLHPPVRTVILTIVGKQLLHLGAAGQTAAIAVAYLATPVVAYFSYFMFETPLRRWLSGRRTGPMQPREAIATAVPHSGT